MNRSRISLFVLLNVLFVVVVMHTEDRADVQDPKTELQTLLQRTAGRIQAMRKKPTTLGLPVYS